MNVNIANLEPKALWNNFVNLNAVPRPSKKEELVIQFVKDFGLNLKLSTYVDEVGNVIIKKPATSGMEDKVTVVLQSHLDMVHQKNAETQFDFNTQGIEMIIVDDWVKANGTTLGADNGIGVAAILSLLESTNIPHPAIEALFTIDEETGMTGALALKGELLDGVILLNLDTEDDNELTIGCAGGIDLTASGKYETVMPKNNVAFTIAIKGLTGGHSGIDIHKGRGNANKIMNRLISSLSKKINLEINSIDGGSLRNAIPRESVAVIVISNNDVIECKKTCLEFEKIIIQEYITTDPKIKLFTTDSSLPSHVLNANFQASLLKVIYACPNGIYRMSPDIKDLVQTSNNVARVMVKEGSYQIQCLTRSSVDSEKIDLQHAISSAFELVDADIKLSGSYPGWTAKPSSPIVSIMSHLYKEMYNEPAKVSACHAGLECGILGTNYPDMQMISFGPNIIGAHSPDEKVQISSVQKFWAFLLETLLRIPNK